MDFERLPRIGSDSEAGAGFDVRLLRTDADAQGTRTWSKDV